MGQFVEFEKQGLRSSPSGVAAARLSTLTNQTSRLFLTMSARRLADFAIGDDLTLLFDEEGRRIALRKEESGDHRLVGKTGSASMAVTEFVSTFDITERGRFAVETMNGKTLIVHLTKPLDE